MEESLKAVDYTDDLDAALQATLRELIGFGGIILLVTTVVAWLINRDITGSLGGLNSVMARLSHGDLDATIPGTERRDEVGAMANAVAVFQGWQRSARIEEIDEVNAIAGSIAAAVEEQSAATADMVGAQRHPTELRAHSERVLRCLDEFARKYSVTVTNQTDQAAASKAA